MIEAIGALLTIIGVLLAHFLKEKPPEVRYEERKQKMDKALADADAVTISRLFDELRTEAGGRNPGRPDDKAPPVG